MKFWNWGPITIWHSIESVAFFSKSLHPNVHMQAYRRGKAVKMFQDAFVK